MTGVNELAEVWRDIMEPIASHRVALADNFAADLDHVAKYKWHSVSWPPTEADADERGWVLVEVAPGGHIEWCLWNRIAEFDGNRRWARIRDVLLLPEGSGE